MKRIEDIKDIKDIKSGLYDSINLHLMQDDTPSGYLERMAGDTVFHEYPFRMLLKLKDVEQSEKYHPEGNVWNHTMLVIDEAAAVKTESRDSQAFMWAALLHDIGKPDTTIIRKGRITSYDHDRTGAQLAGKFLSEFMEEDGFIEKVTSLVRYHMHMLYVLKDLPYGNTGMLLKEVDIHDIALLCLCDRLGRGRVSRGEEEDNYRKFLFRLQSHTTS